MIRSVMTNLGSPSSNSLKELGAHTDGHFYIKSNVDTEQEYILYKLVCIHFIFNMHTVPYCIELPTLIKRLLKSKYPALGRVLWIPMNASTSTTEEYLF